MTDKSNINRKSDADSEDQDIELRKKMNGKYIEKDDVEWIETTTDFMHLKKTGLIFRIDTASYILWDQRYRNQAHIRGNQNGDP